MTDDQRLRVHLVELLRGGGAHHRFETVIARFPADRRGVTAAGLPHTPWQVLEHMRICQRDILEYIRDPHYSAPNFPDDLWPAPDATTDEAGWRHTISQFQADLAALIAIINDPATDIYAQIPHGAPGHTILRESLIIADHNAYHIGEFAILRQILGLW